MILKKKGGEKNEIDRKSGRVKEKAWTRLDRRRQPCTVCSRHQATAALGSGDSERWPQRFVLMWLYWSNRLRLPPLYVPWEGPCWERQRWWNTVTPTVRRLTSKETQHSESLKPEEACGIVHVDLGMTAAVRESLSKPATWWAVVSHCCPTTLAHS
jgi:hypothetical protein